MKRGDNGKIFELIHAENNCEGCVYQGSGVVGVCPKSKRNKGQLICLSYGNNIIIEILSGAKY